MVIIEWIIWAISCIVVVWGLIAFFVEVFRVNPFPEGPERYLSPKVRIFITCSISLVMTAGIIITAVTSISKFHLLWFMPLSFWGSAWFEKQRYLAVNQVEPCPPDTAQWALKKRGFNDEFVKGLREVLGDEKFTSLTMLGEKYYLFDQDFFSNPHSFKDINNNMTKLRVSGFLSHMANELCNRHILDAGEKLSQIVLTLDPKHFSAYATLALICRDSGRLGEARVYAQRAITGMDSFDEGYKDIPVPEYIANPEHITDTRNELHSILALTPDEKEIVKEWTPTREQEEAIDGLDEILKCIGKILCIRYRTMFPADPAHTIVLRAFTVLNELVVKDLRGELVRFYRDNSEFVEREKKEVMMLEEVKKGVLNFLVAKGGYYLSSGIPFAEPWINEAKKVDTNIDIPKTLEDVRETIESCLTWYQQYT